MAHFDSEDFSSSAKRFLAIVMKVSNAFALRSFRSDNAMPSLIEEIVHFSLGEVFLNSALNVSRSVEFAIE